MPSEASPQVRSNLRAAAVAARALAARTAGVHHTAAGERHTAAVARHKGAGAIRSAAAGAFRTEAGACGGGGAAAAAVRGSRAAAAACHRNVHAISASTTADEASETGAGPGRARRTQQRQRWLARRVEGGSRLVAYTTVSHLPTATTASAACVRSQTHHVLRPASHTLLCSPAPNTVHVPFTPGIPRHHSPYLSLSHPPAPRRLRPGTLPRPTTIRSANHPCTTCTATHCCPRPTTHAAPRRRSPAPL